MENNLTQEQGNVKPIRNLYTSFTQKNGKAKRRGPSDPNQPKQENSIRQDHPIPRKEQETSIRPQKALFTGHSTKLKNESTKTRTQEGYRRSQRSTRFRCTPPNFTNITRPLNLPPICAIEQSHNPKFESCYKIPTQPSHLDTYLPQTIQEPG